MQTELKTKNRSFKAFFGSVHFSGFWGKILNKKCSLFSEQQKELIYLKKKETRPFSFLRKYEVFFMIYIFLC